MFRFSMYWMYAIILVFLLGMLYLDDNSISKEVNYTQFCNIVEHGGVKSITVLSTRKEAKAVLSDSIAKQQFKNFTPGESWGRTTTDRQSNPSRAGSRQCR